MDAYSRIIARLDGEALSERPEVYADLVRKGIGGFCLFGGEVEELRAGIRYLQELAGLPLIIASDLEQGLGQQVRGGSLIPSAMAIGSAFRRDASVLPLIEEAWRLVAREALYTGINTILAPVMDLQGGEVTVGGEVFNPIISIRSFGSDPEIVSNLGALMIRVFQEEGIMSCAKHFPGHGDTEIDSHHDLPVIRRSLQERISAELIPFKRAIDEGVSMIMMGHILFPSLDPLFPVSLSERSARFLRDLGFEGLIITDALNMGALKGYEEPLRAEMAVKAGVDLILHPSDPQGVAERLSATGVGSTERLLRCRSKIRLKAEGGRLKTKTKKRLGAEDLRLKPEVDGDKKAQDLSKRIYEKAIEIHGEISEIRFPFLVILDEEVLERASALIKGLGLQRRDYLYIKKADDIKAIPEGRRIILAVFSRPSAFKKRRIPEFRDLIRLIHNRAVLSLSFGTPFVFYGLKGNILYAYDDTTVVQETVSELLRPYIHH